MSNNKRIKVSIVDDQKSYRDSIKEIISKDERIWFYNEYDNATSFIQSLNSPFQPDVCLIDIRLSKDENCQGGLECARKIKEKNPNIHVIIMTGHPDSKNLSEAQKIGADYIEKGTRAEILIDKIITSYREPDEQLVSLRLKHKNKIDIIGLVQAVEDYIEETKKFSPQQKAIINQYLRGIPLEDIASELNITVNTARAHIWRGTHDKKNIQAPNLWNYVDL